MAVPKALLPCFKHPDNVDVNLKIVADVELMKAICLISGVNPNITHYPDAQYEVYWMDINMFVSEYTKANGEPPELI